MATVHLLLSRERDRALLREHLAADHKVRVGESVETDEEGDLWVLDGPSLERHYDDLEALKDDANPVFLPFLLVPGRRAPNQLPETVWTLVDEVIETPVNGAELDARVESLLRQRWQSRELKRHKDRSEARLRSLFETAPDPIVVVRPDGTVTEANEAFGDLFEIDPSEATGERLGALSDQVAEETKRVLLAVEPSVEGPPADPIERSDGIDDETVVTELHVDAVSRLDGVAERVGIFRNVTGKFRREEQLRRQNERLEEFAGTLAHDLRNPLSIAQGSLELVRETGDEADLEGIAEGLDRMEQLIEELLGLAREGKLVLDPEPVDLEAAVERAWTAVGSTDATLVVVGSVELLADRGRLREMFENLFRNSTEHAGDDVEVTVGPLVRDETVTGFFVEDDGPGIPLSDEDMVFEVGYTTEAAGTGIGLRIVKEIAHGHEWTVDLTESDEGGARFEFTGIDRPE